MALIDISLIEELEYEAVENNSLTDAVLLGYERPNATDAVIVGLLKINKQVDRLLDNLRNLYSICDDYSRGILDRYIGEHEYYKDSAVEDVLFDPYLRLSEEIKSNTIFDLPVTIEQYKELKEYAGNYIRFKRIREKALEDFVDGFVGLKYYTVEDGKGGFTAIPESELSAGYVEQLEVKKQLREIEVEYSLDRYNEFYATCQQLIATYEPTSDYQACATEILKLFAPYAAPDN